MSKRIGGKKIILGAALLGGLFLGMTAVAKKKTESRSVDDGNPYLGNDVAPSMRMTAYGRWAKPAMDKLLSFAGLIILSPLFAVISMAIIIDDPGPVFFTQRRVGRDKRFFHLHKFRSMKTSTPHDVPTHQLENPGRYITKVGRMLRKTSLDELPQIWDIFRGKMSVIGPRPALWNQEDLVAEREKYGANGILPGLTGWAQINGRDELEIADKAKLDGDYTAMLCNGGLSAFMQDARCFAGTIASVLRHDGVVEGGTGAYREEDGAAKDKRQESRSRVGTVKEADAGFEDYGYKKKFHIDMTTQRRVLITGANSYIGESFAAYAKERYPNLAIDTVDMIGGSWREHDFTPYDAVFHVAGIAHADVGKVSEEEKARYYAVNTGLALEACRKAKEAGVGQFVFMSSMIVYGDSAPYGKKKDIDEYTVPAPANFYGDSKWQADMGIRAMQSPDFHVAILRPPMIYGRGSKGNYPILAKLAKWLPVFPDVENQRSMLYIDNLCEFVSLLILSGEGGIYFPQNPSYTKTTDMVKEICKANGGSIHALSIFNPAVMAASKIPGKIGNLVNKAFGNAVYSQRLSAYDGLDYHVANLQESIIQTEVSTTSVLILVNHDVVIYNFRLELVERLLQEGYDVHISSPYGERINDLMAIGAKYHEINIDRHGMNPVAEFSVLKAYRKLMKEIMPAVVLGYTIKPNIYGAIAARQARIPFIANITGLGIAVESGGWKPKLTVALYKYAFTDVWKVFFQNEENRKFFRDAGIAASKHAILPGSGVNLVRFPLQPYPSCGDGIDGEPIRFAFISRIMKEKGIEQYLEAAKTIKARYPATEFHICGFCEDEYDGRLDELSQNGTVIYHGMIRDVAGFMSQMHCIVHPTYYPEGLSNVLLEAGACGRAIITTDRAGCREAVENNGYLVSERSTTELVKAIERFIRLSQTEKEAMGMAGRKLVEEKFDRQIVVKRYMDEIHMAGNKYN